MMTRTTKYFYDENDKLTRMESHETDEMGVLCDGRNEGVLLEDSVELPCETVSPIGLAAMILASIGLGISIARFFQNR